MRGRSSSRSATKQNDAPIGILRELALDRKEAVLSLLRVRDALNDRIVSPVAVVDDEKTVS